MRVVSLAARQSRRRVRWSAGPGDSDGKSAHAGDPALAGAPLSGVTAALAAARLVRLRGRDPGVGVRFGLGGSI